MVGQGTCGGKGGGEIFAIGMVASITHGEKNTERKKRQMAG